jgi:hypothetical protein
VESGKDIYFAAQSWAATVADIKWNKIADLYKKAQTLANTNAKIIDGNKKTTNPQATMRTAHVTRWQFEHWFLSAGDRIFAQFFSKKVDSFIGEKVLKTMFLLRVGLEGKDVLALVEEEAKLEAIERQQVLRRLEATAAFVNLLEDEHGKIRPSAEVLQQRWQKLAEAADVADSKGVFNAAKDARIALVVAVLEAFNTAKTLRKAYEKPDAKSILGLATAVSGLTAAVTDVAANITKGFYGDASMTYQRMKFVGRSLSSVASLGSSVSSGLGAADALSERRYIDAALNLLLTVFSAASSAVGLIAALTYCGPFPEKIAKRQGLVAGGVRLFGLPAVG